MLEFSSFSILAFWRLDVWNGMSGMGSLPYECYNHRLAGYGWMAVLCGSFRGNVGCLLVSNGYESVIIYA